MCFFIDGLSSGTMLGNGVAVFYHEIITPLSLAGAVIVVTAVVSYNVWEAKAKEEIQEV